MVPWLLLLAAPQPAAPPRRDAVPPGFWLWFAAPGCEPGEECDDVGPPRAVRRRFAEAAGANVGELTIAWRDTERRNPGDGPSSYVFERCRPSDWDRARPHLLCELDHFDVPWATFRFTDRERYNRLLERWAEAACRYARERFGCTVFSAGGNERDLVAPETYRPHYPDWHFFYVDPLRAIHAGMKRAHPANRLVIGNLCYSDREHIAALYDAGAKGHFEILAIHAYGAPGAHVDLEQVIESRQEMAARGDADIPILVTEGWSSLPLPASLERDPAWRRGGRPFTGEELEHFRQSVLDGWRNLRTPRPGEYDPAWLLGARYFVLNDHWGGRGWAARAQPQHDEAGGLRGFLLDGYFIGTSDPEFIQPLLRPWGLIDIEGQPKGDIITEFPPSFPAHRFAARLAAELPVVPYHPQRAEWTAPEAEAERAYPVEVTLENRGTAAWEALRVEVTGEVAARRVGPPPPDRLVPGETVRWSYELSFGPELDRRTERGWRVRSRPRVEAWFRVDGRPYHTDAWLPRVVVRRR